MVQNFFNLKQLTAVQDVMDTDVYAVFTTKVGQAELDSMDRLGLKVPYLSEWADKQAASKRLAEPATKRQRVQLRQGTPEPGSALAAKRKEYAAFVESAECARLDMVMAHERARLARQQAEAEAAIAADNRAVQPTQTATATTDIPCMLNLRSTSAIPMLPAAEATRDHHTCTILPAQRRHALDTGGRVLFRGDSVAAIWREWQHGGLQLQTGTGLCWVFMPMPRQRIGWAAHSSRKAPKKLGGVIKQLLKSHRWNASTIEAQKQALLIQLEASP
ncbi:TPA: hypothetical protein ACH3X1_006070 [Trebouxia sp. C0004]